MRSGKSIPELVQTLESIEAQKRDYVVPTTSMSYEPGDPGQRGTLAVKFGDKAEDGLDLEITPHAHGQMTDYVGIPRKYVDRMLTEAPELLAQNVNHWLRSSNEPRMLRTLDGSARAFLSNRYRRIDNFNIMQAVLPQLLPMVERGELEVRAADVTGTAMYLEATFTALRGEIRVGDECIAGFQLRNSEIGGSAVQVVPFVYRLVCTNGLIVPREIEAGQLRRQHLGRLINADESREIFRDDTIEADDKAIMLKVRDSITAMSDRDLFTRVLAQMSRAAANSLPGDPVEVVDRVLEAYQLPTSSRTGILSELLSSRDLTQWGLVNAITAQAHASETFDDNIQWQEVGGKLLVEQDLRKALARRKAA